MKYFQFIFFVIIMVLTTCQCKDDDMVDPCDNEELQPISAAFDAYTEIGWSDNFRQFKSDTFFMKRDVIFKAEQEWLSYKWTIGDDPRVFNDREFSLYFQDITTPVNIQLIVEGTPNTDCFPNDDGRDTLNKKIYFVEFETSPLFGFFRGTTSSNPNDTFNIELQVIPPDGSTNIDNLPKGCTREENNRMGFQATFRNFALRNLGNYVICPKPQGWGHLDTNGNISIEYEIYDSDLDEVVSDSFNGKKIQ